jgi:hypothetical protein
MASTGNLKSRTWLFALLGFGSLVWFLVRVIPKPDRAAYPCQRAAFPLASGFVLWVAGLCTSVLFFRRAREKMRQAQYAAAALSLAAVIAALGFTFLGSPSEPVAAQGVTPFVPGEGPNQPMGEGRGIYPGRVVWVHDPKATSWDGKTGYWWEDASTDPTVVGEMVSRSLHALTGRDSDAAAWDALFRNFNSRRGKGDVGYQPGEKIAVKLNLNQVGGYGSLQNRSVAGPQIVLAYLRQLVNVASVSDADIALYDASRYVPSELLTPVRAEFPNVRFIDWGGGRGREKYARDPDVRVHWSAQLTLEEGGGNPTYLPTAVTEAAYLINLGILKGHDLAGITLCAKNHFGSICTDVDGSPSSNPPKGAGIHPYVAVHEFRGGKGWNFDMREMGTYNALVDLMGHEHLGEKTLLFVVDGLYATPRQNPPLEGSDTWQMAPFSGDWPSSLFVSQDGVAIESVGLDFLRSEPSQVNVYGNVDNYLHEAALAQEPPSGSFYDPEGDGSRLPSLGAHEHWNNPVDRQYSRNLGKGFGVELVTPDMATAVLDGAGTASLPRAVALSNHPNPFNAGTVLVFSLPVGGRTRLEVYNGVGQRLALVWDEYLPAGSHSAAWDGRGPGGREAGSGVYFTRLTTGGSQTTRKMLLAR